MSYPHMFSTPSMGTLADKVDDLRRVLLPIAKPTKDGTGSATAIAQAGFHRDHFAQLQEKGKETWRDLMRAQVNEAFALKDPEELQEAIVRIVAYAADWYHDISRRPS